MSIPINKLTILVNKIDVDTVKTYIKEVNKIILFKASGDLKTLYDYNKYKKLPEQLQLRLFFRVNNELFD